MYVKIIFEFPNVVGCKFFAKKRLKTGRKIGNSLQMGYRGGWCAGICVSLKKARKVPFLTEEDYENAVFNSKTKSDASSCFFHKAKPFLKAKNERFGGFM